LALAIYATAYAFNPKNNASCPKFESTGSERLNVLSEVFDKDGIVSLIGRRIFN
jgi:hypothetical protein